MTVCADEHALLRCCHRHLTLAFNIETVVLYYSVCVCITSDGNWHFYASNIRVSYDLM